MNKKAISFIEIIISISIIVLLASVWLSYKASYDDNKFNLKVKSDLATLNNSFLSYKQENSTLPIAKSNDNFFKEDSSYAHDASDDAFWVYGYVTSDLIPKKYLAYLPLDPRTNQFYAYWKTLDPKNLQFEFAWVTTKDNESSTMVTWDYSWEKTVWLIREYNWPQFLYDKTDSHFPYNPTERLMTAKIGSFSGTVTINWSSNNILNQTLVAWDKIEVWSNWFANIYYSDGSRSTLEKNSNLVLTKMNYPSNSNSNLITKIKLTLKNWTIWTKATKLNPAWSEFEITTQDATAAVRWTIFKVQKDSTSSETIVEVDKWKVDVINNQTPTLSGSVTNQKQIKSTSTSLSAAISASLIVPNDEILLPSNTKPEIEKITTSDSTKTITIKQAKTWDIIKDKNWNQVWTCTNIWCSINDISIKKIKFCRVIWEEGSEVKYNCSKEIKLDKNYTKKDLVAEKLKDAEDNNDDNANISNCAMNVNWECVKNELSWSWYKLIAYAPYDDCSQIENNHYYNYNSQHWENNTFDNSLFKLYTKDSPIYWYSNFGFANYNQWKTSTCKTVWNVKWFKIDNTWTAEYLKYDLNNLNLWNKFAIEMSVKWSDLNRDSWTHTLFDFWNNNNAFLQLEFNWNENKFDENKFYKVTYFSDWNINISWNWININSSETWNIFEINKNKIEKSQSFSTKTWSSDSIYIGSSDYKTQQWDWIIDYVKIYKKD